MKKLIMLAAFACLIVSAYADKNEYLTKENFWKVVESRWETKMPDYTADYVKSGYSYNANADFEANAAKEIAANEYIVPVSITTEVNYKNETKNTVERKEYKDTLNMHVYHDIVNDSFWVIDQNFDSEAKA
jgi:hypothetical protein